jgi:hypothetical protein
MTKSQRFERLLAEMAELIDQDGLSDRAAARVTELLDLAWRERFSTGYLARAISKVCEAYHRKGLSDQLEPLFARFFATPRDSNDQFWMPTEAELGYAYLSIADFYFEHALYDCGERYFIRALDQLLRHFRGYDHYTTYDFNREGSPDVFHIQKRLAAMQTDDGRYREARRHYLRMLKPLSKRYGRESREVAEVHQLLVKVTGGEWQACIARILGV